MRVRINVSLDEETVRLVDRVAGKGNRSAFIEDAVTRHAAELRRRTLRDRLKEGAIARADRDRALAADWADAEDEAWLRKG
jgi:CopG family transcriptional regulator/antitoxin EndoAI